MSAHITMFNPAQRRVAVAAGPSAAATAAVVSSLQPKVVSLISGPPPPPGSSGGVGAATATTTILAFGSSPPSHHQLQQQQQLGPPSPLDSLHTTAPEPGGGSLIVFDPASYPSPTGGTTTGPNGQIYIEVRQSSHGYLSPLNGSQLTEIKTEPQPFSPTNSTASQSSFTSSSYEQSHPSQLQYYTSPPPPHNSFQSQQEIDRKTKKGPAVRPQEELCTVCGDRASGYHYNALACEGCKGFFRRSITKNAKYVCKYGGSCDIDMYMRRKCQECRFRKCITVGMRAECVVPEAQCAIKRSNKKPPLKAVASSPSVAGGGGGGGGGSSGPIPDYRLKLARPLKPEEEELINQVVFFQDFYELPSTEELQRIEHAVAKEGITGNWRIRQICETTIRVVELIVEFCKKLPGFNTLRVEDQVTLLKSCSSEVMMIRMARRYDVHTDSIIFANNQPFDREAFKKAGMGDYDEMFSFCRTMSDMKVDNAEYGLLTALVIFSERFSLHEPKKVEKIQEIYVEAFEAYVYNRRSRQNVMFAKLLNTLCVVKNLANKNSEQVFSLMISDEKFPKILSEMWGQ